MDEETTRIAAFLREHLKVGVEVWREAAPYGTEFKVTVRLSLGDEPFAEATDSVFQAEEPRDG